MSKGLLALESIIETFYDKDSEDIQIVRKELKALEIIKSSGYISLDIMLSQNYISRKEYDLLKEVLK